MVSIREVARLAGVSASTVSRVMNGTANVDDSKKQRVLTAIEQTGYQPNELARALYKKSSKIIGVIVPNIENPFFSELAKAIEEESYREGYRILLCNSNDNPEKELVNIQILTQMKADGMIIMTNCDSTGQALADCPLPAVVVDRKMMSGGEIAYIESNHYEGGRLAAEHLIQCGCRNIVCLRGPLEFSSGRQRYQGYQDVCREYGIEEQCIDCKYDFEAGIDAATEMVKRYPKMDGVIACNDMVAMSVYKVLLEKGYRIPEDVQLVGFDNIKFSWLFTPEITTVAQPIPEMGKMAARIIIRHVNGEEYQKENIFDVSLLQRQTTRKKGE